MRQPWRALHAIPQLLLVQPDQASYDLVYALALLPPLLLGSFFFGRNALLLIGVCFLTGIVCLLALQLARLTFRLPAWVGYRANHPLVASLIVVCFLSPLTPAALGVALVALLVILDILIWPRLGPLMAHPALLVFGVLFFVQRQVTIGFVNPFDGRRLDDPLALWSRLGVMVDPIKLYVGNVPGPIGATSAAALLLGLAYLWYTQKISLGFLSGFLAGLATLALALRYDVALQVSTGPALFLAGYLASDRRRIMIPTQVTFVAGAVAGGLTLVLRAAGQGQEATWEALLLVGALVTLALRLRSILPGKPAAAPASGGLRSRSISSGSSTPPPLTPAGVRAQVREPVMAMASSSVWQPVVRRPAPSFDIGSDPYDLVRQMRSAAARDPLRRAANRLLWALALLLLNPVGLWLTWKSRSLSRRTKQLVSGLSSLWYVTVAGLLFLALTRGLLKA